MSWLLRRTTQCKGCPWIKGSDPSQIPNGYSIVRHKALAKTIAKEGSLELTPAMACHEMHDTHCVGWVVNQVGPGNNIPLRMLMRSCANADRIRLRGEQHACFDDTIPKEIKR